MKSIAFLASTTYFSQAHADLVQIEKDVDRLSRELIANGTEIYRGLGNGAVIAPIAMINGYGCWCYFTKVAGKGSPQNEIDDLCRTLQNGYDCAILDGREENEECVPWDKQYH